MKARRDVAIFYVFMFFSKKMVNGTRRRFTYSLRTLHDYQSETLLYMMLAEKDSNLDSNSEQFALLKIKACSNLNMKILFKQ